MGTGSFITTSCTECVLTQTGWTRGRWTGCKRGIKAILWNLRRAVTLTIDKEKGGQRGMELAFIVSLNVS